LCHAAFAAWTCVPNELNKRANHMSATTDLDLRAGAGNAIKGKRDQYVIATKFGIFYKNGAHVADASPEHIRSVQALQAALRLNSVCPA